MIKLSYQGCRFDFKGVQFSAKWPEIGHHSKNWRKSPLWKLYYNYGPSEAFLLLWNFLFALSNNGLY